MEKECGQGSLSDLLEMGVEDEVFSSEKGRGQIARKLTFGREIMNQYSQGFESIFNKLPFFKFKHYNYITHICIFAFNIH